MLVSVFSNTDYHVVQKGKMWGTTKRVVPYLCAGSGILMEDGNGVILITAAHVVAGDASPVQIVVRKDGKAVETITMGSKAWVESASFTVRISNLSLCPIGIVINREKDLALVRLSADDLKLLAATTFTKSRPSQVGQQVNVWGFHDSPDTQLEEARVSDLGREFFVINRPMDGGFSGGPVMDLSGALLGIVSRSTDKQTRCVKSEEIVDFIQHNRDKIKPYSDAAELP